MNHHRRLPAVVILIAMLAAGGFFLARANPANGTPSDDLSPLELAIATGRAPPDIWLQYANALLRIHQFSHATDAFHKVLELQPYDRSARLGLGLALTGNQDAPALSAFLTDLSIQDPKLALELLDRPACIALLPSDASERLYREAKAQAAD